MTASSDKVVNMANRPTGTVTFLFTDIQGSTRLLKDVGHAAYEELLATHRRLLRGAVEQADGVVVDMQGDACLAVFRSGADAVVAAATGQRNHAKYPWPTGCEIRVRMGLHTGDARVGEEGYIGLAVITARGSPRPATAARCCCRP